jgi:integrase
VPKPAEKERFQTWQQITRRIKRESLCSKQAAPIWASLFLDEQQVADLLLQVQKNALRPFIYPMYAFAAYTGARRSEILRSHVDDFDFEQRLVRIREKKRRKNLSSSTRFVPLNQHLVSIMQEWFDVHPGGGYTITARDMNGRVSSEQLKPRSVHDAFKQPLANSKWSIVRGFHVLRHSFGANLARSGKISSERIGRWMGHSTEDMRELYQHLFPQDGPALIDVLGYGER